MDLIRVSCCVQAPENRSESPCRGFALEEFYCLMVHEELCTVAHVPSIVIDGREYIVQLAVVKVDGVDEVSDGDCLIKCSQARYPFEVCKLFSIAQRFDLIREIYLGSLVQKESIQNFPVDRCSRRQGCIVLGKGPDRDLIEAEIQDQKENKDCKYRYDEVSELDNNFSCINQIFIHIYF